MRSPFARLRAARTPSPFRSRTRTSARGGLGDGGDGVQTDVGEGLDETARPADLAGLDRRRVAESEVERLGALREVAARGVDLTELRAAAGAERGDGADRVAVALRAGEAQRHPVPLWELVAEERRSVVVVAHDEVRTAVAVEVA